MRITEAASRLGTSPRMLRYRDLLGLLPRVRDARAGRGGSAHRRFDDEDLAAMTMALDFERRYDVSPAAVSFGMRVLTEPRLRAELAEVAPRHRADPAAAGAGPGVREGAGAAAAEPHACRRGPNRRRGRGRRTARIAGSVASALDSRERSG